MIRDTTTNRIQYVGTRAAALLMVLLGCIAPANAQAGGPGANKISPDLRAGRGAMEVAGKGNIDVIVQFRRHPEAQDIENVVAKGGRLRRAFRHVPAAVFHVPGQALEAIASHPHVLYVSPDRAIQGNLEFAAPAVGADAAFSSGWTGVGVGIAILDSGMNPDHPDLKGRIVRSENFVPNETTTDDAYGHGTHVAVAAAGNATASTGNSYTITFRGIAPRSHLANFRVLDAAGKGSDSAVIAAIDRAIELRSQLNIRVLNLSLGRNIVESHSLDPLCAAVERAWNAGIVVVVAAGNNGRDNATGASGYATISSPGNSPRVITVGAMKDMGTATRADDLMTSYSSKGPTLLDHVAKPDLVAPGNLVIAGVAAGAGLRATMPENVVPVTYYRTSNSLNTSSVYFRLSGTSIAAPIVSGAAALLLQKTPTLTPDQVKARLMKTAGKNFPATSSSTDPATGATYHVTYDLFTVGAGYLDIGAALNNAEFPVGNASSPTAVFNAADGTTSVLVGSGTVWGDVVVWGSTVVWGSAIVWGSQSSSGFVVVWGSDTPASSSDPFPLNVAGKGEL